MEKSHDCECVFFNDLFTAVAAFHTLASINTNTNSPLCDVFNFNTYIFNIFSLGMSRPSFFFFTRLCPFP